MNISRLTSLDQFEACLELQREGFGWADVDLMPVRLFVVTHHIGGLVLGAYRDDKLLGFLSTIPGVREGKPYWHSHMLAVSRECRDSGIGTQLKLAQRDHARQCGIRLIEWTFDPLESKNAHLNIGKLGVIVRRYYPDLYGRTSAASQGELQSDRIVAEWWVDRPRTDLIGEARRVTIPSDILAMKQADPGAAGAVQTRVREEFLQNLSDDFYVAAFERRGESSDYIFVSGASGAHSMD